MILIKLFWITMIVILYITFLFQIIYEHDETHIQLLLFLKMSLLR